MFKTQVRVVIEVFINQMPLNLSFFLFALLNKISGFLRFVPIAIMSNFMQAIQLSSDQDP